MNFEQSFHEKLLIINERLNLLVQALDTPYQSLFHAARYALNTPGKRLRPLLTLLTAEMLEGRLESALNPACAIEMVHTYSMIHDDLPCMDNDDFRRGMPTVHKAFTEATALLAGDFLLTYAFQVLAQAPGINDANKIELIALLSQNGGGTGMIGGQVMDLEAENKEVSFDTLKMIHQKKTGALISASIEFGAIVADAPMDVRLQVREFGYLIGLAFQVVDDILDVTASVAKHGKQTSSDVMKKKSTAVSLLGLEGAQAQAERLIREADAILDSLPFNSSGIKLITKYFLDRKR